MGIGGVFNEDKPHKIIHIVQELNRISDKGTLVLIYSQITQQNMIII